MSGFAVEDQGCQLDVDVVDHEIDDELSSLDAHIFTLEIWLNQEPYQIRRSYKDICELDVRLNKQYPKTTLPPSPFSASTSFVPEGTSNKKRGGLVAFNRRGSLQGMDPEELVSQKKPALLVYLKALLDIPEIVRSTSMLDFLDMASPNGEGYESPSINLLEMLLGDTPEKSVNIVKKHSVKFDVMAGEYLVWKFSTKKRDLGFSIDINDDNVLTYQRHNCQEKAIESVLKCPVTGSAALLWDNTYSKLRTKHLSFRCCVIPSEHYKESSKRCVDLSREQQVNTARRGGLQRELVQRARQLLKAQAGDEERLVSQDFTVDMTSGDKVVHEDLQEEITQLRNEKGSLQMALSESEITLADTREELVEMKKKLEKSSSLAGELERVTSERDELQSEVLEESMARKRREVDLGTATSEVVAAQDQLERESNQHQATAHALASLQHQHALLHEENASLVAEAAQVTADQRGGGTEQAQQIQRLKGEKKQLKAYAISLKGQLEDVERAQKESRMADQAPVLELAKELTSLLSLLQRELRGMQELQTQCTARVEGGEEDEGEGEGAEEHQEALRKVTAAVQSGSSAAEHATLVLKRADEQLAPPSASPSVMTGESEDAPLPEHSGSVFASVIVPHSSSSSSSSSNSSSPRKGDHPSGCKCMRCKAPPRKASLMQAVIDTFVDKSSTVDDL